MKALPLALLCSVLFSWALVAQAPPAGERHEFAIANFHTESGVTLPQARVVYGTYGHLNADRSNAVLLPSHYMANFHGYEWLIGSGKALDPSQLFLVTTELFGNGSSSSPSNTPEPFHGPRFPVTTIRDNVDAVHRLLTEELKITHLRAVVGFSMGAQQAFQWAVSYPDFADRIVATSGTAKTYPHGIVRLEGQIAALTADPAFEGGDYKTPPRKGLEAFGMVWAGWLYSQEWWRARIVARFFARRHNIRTGLQQLSDQVQCRRERLHPAGPYVGAARCRRHSRIRRERRTGARLDQGSAFVYALGDGSLLSDRRCALRSSIHSESHPDADSVSMGSHGRRRKQSRRCEIPERKHRALSLRTLAEPCGLALGDGGQWPITKSHVKG